MLYRTPDSTTAWTTANSAPGDGLCGMSDGMALTALLFENEAGKLRQTSMETHLEFLGSYIVYFIGCITFPIELLAGPVSHNHGFRVKTISSRPTDARFVGNEKQEDSCFLCSLRLEYN